MGLVKMPLFGSGETNEGILLTLDTDNEFEVGDQVGMEISYTVKGRRAFQPSFYSMSSTYHQGGVWLASNFYIEPYYYSSPSTGGYITLVKYNVSDNTIEALEKRIDNDNNAISQIIPIGSNMFIAKRLSDNKWALYKYYINTMKVEFIRTITNSSYNSTAVKIDKYTAYISDVTNNKTLIVSDSVSDITINDALIPKAFNSISINRENNRIALACEYISSSKDYIDFYVIRHESGMTPYILYSKTQFSEHNQSIAKLIDNTCSLTDGRFIFEYENGNSNHYYFVINPDSRSVTLTRIISPSTIFLKNICKPDDIPVQFRSNSITSMYASKIRFASVSDQNSFILSNIDGNFGDNIETFFNGNLKQYKEQSVNLNILSNSGFFSTQNPFYQTNRTFYISALLGNRLIDSVPLNWYATDSVGDNIGKIQKISNSTFRILVFGYRESGIVTNNELAVIDITITPNKNSRNYIGQITDFDSVNKKVILNIPGLMN